MQSRGKELQGVAFDQITVSITWIEYGIVCDTPHRGKSS